MFTFHLLCGTIVCMLSWLAGTQGVELMAWGCAKTGSQLPSLGGLDTCCSEQLQGLVLAELQAEVLNLAGTMM